MNQATAPQAPTACTLVIKKPTDFIKISSMITLIYGQPGTRKTSYAGTSPNPILFDFDNGVRRVDEDYRCPFVPAEYLKDWDSVEKQLSHPQFQEFETFIFDSVTKLLDYMSDFVMKKDLKNKKSGGGLSLAGYGSLGDVFKSFLSKMEIMGKNIVFVAHDKEGKDGDSTRLRPDIAGQSLGFVTRSADMIGYIEMINNESVVQFTPTDRFYAKNSCKIEPQFPTSKISLADVIEKYKIAVNQKSAENKIYKATMNTSIELLNGVETVEQLNEAYKEMTVLPHALTSKRELFDAYKEYADNIGCFFNAEIKAFDEYEKVEVVVEEKIEGKNSDTEIPNVPAEEEKAVEPKKQLTPKPKNEKPKV